MTSDVIVGAEAAWLFFTNCSGTGLGAEARGSQMIWQGTPMVSLGFSWGKTVVRPMISSAQ